MRELYEKGIGFRIFMLNMKKDRRGRFMKYYIPITINAEHREKIDSLEDNIKILGIVDEDCTDCDINLPVLEKLICTNNKIELRLISKEHLKREIRVPTFVFMDDNYNVIGEFVEKPKIVKEADINTAAGEMVNERYINGKLTADIAAEFMSIISAIDNSKTKEH